MIGFRRDHEPEEPIECRGHTEEIAIQDVPFTQLTHTLIDGRVVWDRDKYLKLPFARRALPMVSGGGVWVQFEWVVTA